MTKIAETMENFLDFLNRNYYIPGTSKSIEEFRAELEKYIHYYNTKRIKGN